MGTKTLKILTDFSEYPGIRYSTQCEKSGEEFYHECLNGKFTSAYRNNEVLCVDLDGSAGYPPSFLDEAFGNLIYDFSLEIVVKHINIISNDEPDLKDYITNKIFPSWQERRNSNKEPKKTKLHNKWFRISKDKLEEEVWIKQITEV